MPRGGHNKKPESLKIIQGTFRKDRANPNSPKLKSIAPSPSYSLPKQAKNEYLKLSKLLLDMGVLSEPDQGELENLSIIRAQIKYLSKRLFNVTDMNEFRKVQIAINDAIKISNALSIRFGLSPADRSRVNLSQEKKHNKWEEFERRNSI